MTTCTSLHIKTKEAYTDVDWTNTLNNMFSFNPSSPKKTLPPQIKNLSPFSSMPKIVFEENGIAKQFHLLKPIKQQVADKIA